MKKTFNHAAWGAAYGVIVFLGMFFYECMEFDSMHINAVADMINGFVSLDYDLCQLFALMALSIPCAVVGALIYTMLDAILTAIYGFIYDLIYEDDEEETEEVEVKATFITVDD